MSGDCTSWWMWRGGTYNYDKAHRARPPMPPAAPRALVVHFVGVVCIAGYVGGFFPAFVGDGASHSSPHAGISFSHACARRAVDDRETRKPVPSNADSLSKFAAPGDGCSGSTQSAGTKNSGIHRANHAAPGARAAVAFSVVSEATAPPVASSPATAIIPLRLAGSGSLPLFASRRNKKSIRT